jgi:hypothetical protein
LGRTIITKKDLKAAATAKKTKVRLYSVDAVPSGSEIPQAADGYADKLVKYIPAEIVAAFIAVNSIMHSVAVPSAVAYWAMFLFLLILTPVYLWRLQGVRKRMQLLLSSVAFVIWVFGIGGPFSYLSWYSSYAYVGGLLIIAYTLGVAVIDP